MFTAEPLLCANLERKIHPYTGFLLKERSLEPLKCGLAAAVDGSSPPASDPVSASAGAGDSVAVA